MEVEHTTMLLSAEKVAPQLPAATAIVKALEEITSFMHKMEPVEAMIYGVAIGLTMMKDHVESSGGEIKFAGVETLKHLQ